MLNIRNQMKRSLFGAAICATLSVSAVAAPPTQFQIDVAKAIDDGITYLANQGVYNNPSSLGNDSAQGLAMQALLEKRASGNPADPAQGYTGANAVDQGRLRTAAAFILDRVNETSHYAYRDGQWMFALSGYALTGGPDKSTLAPGNADYQTIKEAMDALVTRTLSFQRASGYWCYGPAVGILNCDDSSTTQFAAAGLHAAKSFYGSPKVADDSFADAAKVALIDAALLKVKTAYEANALSGSNNGSCNVLTGTEKGHGYNRATYAPSLQQTASGIYIQLFGGSTVNSPMVQNYMEWVKNRYRYTDLDSLGNNWPGLSMGYYMWSSFKAMELIRQAGIAPAAGNIGPNDLGTLPAVNSPACVVRQENKNPAAIPQPVKFGGAAAGVYAVEPKGQYFDYAHQLINMQCANGAFTCTGYPGAWETYSHQAYALLVLQRSTGNIIQRCDVDGDSDIDTADLGLIRTRVGKPLLGNELADGDSNGVIDARDVRACTFRCTRAACATN